MREQACEHVSQSDPCQLVPDVRGKEIFKLLDDEV